MNTAQQMTNNGNAQKARAVAAFLKWMEKSGAPRGLMKEVYTRAGLENNGLSAMGQDDTRPWYEKAIDAVKDALPTYIQYKTQNKILDAQLRRAEQGLPPLETAQYAPTMQLEHRLPQQYVQTGQNTALIIGGLVVGGLLLFAMMNRPARRR